MFKNPLESLNRSPNPDNTGSFSNEEAKNLMEVLNARYQTTKKEKEELEQGLKERTEELKELTLRKIKLQWENAKRVALYPDQGSLGRSDEQSNLFGYSIDQLKMETLEGDGSDIFVYLNDERILALDGKNLKKKFPNAKSALEIANKVIEEYGKEYYIPGLDVQRAFLEYKLDGSTGQEVNYLIGSMIAEDGKFYFPCVHDGSNFMRPGEGEIISSYNVPVEEGLSDHASIILIKREIQD